MINNTHKPPHAHSEKERLSKMGWLKDIKKAVERIEDNTERTADTLVDLFNLTEEQQKEALRRKM